MDGEDVDIKEEAPPAEEPPADDAMAAIVTKDDDASPASNGGADEGADGVGNNDNKSDVIGSAALRPVFLGNLNHNCKADDVAQVFDSPIIDGANPVPVDRVDLKRGFCFVFLKDAVSQEAKEQSEKYVSDINGMTIDKVSKALRSEFARGDGRIKRKEDDRRKAIQPSETLFVVNFHEETTKREDLQMLFEPYGELVRIDMKRNYAFVQFTTTDDAKRAKEATNGGKLDQSIITVEYVARRMGEGGGGERRGGGGRDRDRDRGGYRGDRRGPPPGSYGRGGGYDGRRGGRDDRYDDYRESRGGGGGGNRGRDDRYDDRGRGGYRSRSRSPGGYRRGRSRSRSRSPPHRHRSRSPSPGGSGRRHRDEYRGGGRSGGYEDRDGSRGRGRGGGDDYSRGDRADRGYRS